MPRRKTPSKQTTKGGFEATSITLPPSLMRFAERHSEKEGASGVSGLVRKLLIAEWERVEGRKWDPGAWKEASETERLPNADELKTKKPDAPKKKPSRKRFDA